MNIPDHTGDSVRPERTPALSPDRRDHIDATPLDDLHQESNSMQDSVEYLAYLRRIESDVKTAFPDTFVSISSIGSGPDGARGGVHVSVQGEYVDRVREAFPCVHVTPMSLFGYGWHMRREMVARVRGLTEDRIRFDSEKSARGLQVSVPGEFVDDIRAKFSSLNVRALTGSEYDRLRVPENRYPRLHDTGAEAA